MEKSQASKVVGVRLPPDVEKWIREKAASQEYPTTVTAIVIAALRRQMSQDNQ